MAFVKEFRDFIARGNVVDLAVGVILGAAFGKIVTSLVNDVMMPPLGLALGKVDFSSLFVPLRSGQHYESLKAARDAGAPVIAYGQFINVVLEFLIVAFVVFLVVKGVNALHPRPAAAAVTRECPRCMEKVALKATRCPHCTSEIAAA
jgi:large conductance mechanosensitive channel